MLKINNKYMILEKLGNGSFGTIYKGQNLRTRENVAIKVEPISRGTKLLKNESIIYHYLSDIKGIPNVKWFGKDEINYYMVLDLLGYSLEDMVRKSGPFSLQVVLHLGIQCIELIERIHNKGLIHRDIKPDNFLLNVKNNINEIYLIDFGFCKTFIKDNENKYSHNLIGTPSFASINAHEMRELSMRDDMESLCYMLIYLYLGKLRWQDSSKYNIEIIKKMKDNIYNDNNVPNILLEYMRINKLLRFNDKPNYKEIKELFEKEIKLLDDR
jgi:serine/threonine protein kinase